MFLFFLLDFLWVYFPFSFVNFVANDEDYHFLSNFLINKVHPVVYTIKALVVGDVIDQEYHLRVFKKREHHKSWSFLTCGNLYLQTDRYFFDISSFVESFASNWILHRYPNTFNSEKSPLTYRLAMQDFPQAVFPKIPILSLSLFFWSVPFWTESLLI